MPKPTQKTSGNIIDRMFFFNPEFKKSNSEFFSALKLDVPGGNADALNKCGFHGTRQDSMSAVFRFFLMSRDEPNMDFKQAYQMRPPHPDFEKNWKEFIDFAKAHPTRTENLDLNTKKENIKAWTNVFKKATEKIKTYQFPKIDYGDPVQIFAHREELSALISCYINFSQEFRDSFYNGLGKDSTIVDETLGGKKGFQEMMRTWEDIAFVIQPLQSGYMPANLDDYSNNSSLRDVNYMISCSQRYCLSRISDRISGRKLGDIVENYSPKDLYQSEINMGICGQYDLENVKSSDNAKREGYLQNLDHSLDQVFKKQYDAQEKKARLKFNSNRKYEAQSKFTSHLESSLKRGLSDRMAKLYEGNPSAEELAERINSKDFEQLSFEIDSLYHGGFDSDHQDRIFQILNERVINNFLIGGKSPKELWGEKYAFLNDPQKIEKMYRVELINEITTGNKDIEMTTWYMDQKGQCHKAKPVSVIKSKETREREVAVLVAMDDLYEDLVATRKQLQDTQKDKDANMPAAQEKTGSDLYRKMFSALNKCIECSYIQKNDRNMNDLQKALREYHKASAEYYKKRKGIMFAPRGNGKTRLDLAKYAADNILDKAEKLGMLAGGLDLTPSSNDARDQVNTNYKILNRHGVYEVEKRLPNRGGNVEYFNFLAKQGNAHEITDEGRQTFEKFRTDIAIKQAKKKELREALKQTLKEMVFADEKLEALDAMILTENKPTSMCAKNVVSEKYLEKINDPMISMEELTKLEKKLEPVQLKKEVVELVKSPLFREVTAKCPKTYEKKWNKLEKNADEVRKDYEKNIEILSDRLQKESDAYFGVGMGENNEPQPIPNDKREEMEMQIAHLMTLKVLTGAHNPDIMRAVATSGDNFTAVFDASLAYVKEKNLAKQDKLANTIENVTTKNDFAGPIVDKIVAMNPDQPKAKLQKPIIKQLIQPHREIERGQRAPGLI